MARIVRILIAAGLFGAALAAQTHSVTLTWPANTTGGAVTSYNVLKGTTAGGESTTPIGTVAASACTGTPATCTYVDTANLVEGQTYYYEVTATNSTGTSGPSPEASATIPFSLPAIPAKPAVVVK